MSAKPRVKPLLRTARPITDFERAVADLAAKMARSPSRWSHRRARRQFEQLYVAYVVEKVGGDKREAARVLGISYASLKEKVRADWMRR